jgi:hypothetical protein
MITGILIPQDETSGLEERSFDGLTDYQAAVGGWVEAIHIKKPSMTLFVNEEGKIQGLPRNARATTLWWLLSPLVRQLDVIVGDAVLIGSNRGQGTTSELPPTYRVLLMETPKYQVEMTNERGRWQRDRREFSSYFEAAIYAMLIADRANPFGPIETKARIVPA